MKLIKVEEGRIKSWTLVLLAMSQVQQSLPSRIQRRILWAIPESPGVQGGRLLFTCCMASGSMLLLPRERAGDQGKLRLFEYFNHKIYHLGAPMPLLRGSVYLPEPLSGCVESDCFYL